MTIGEGPSHAQSVLGGNGLMSAGRKGRRRAISTSITSAGDDKNSGTARAGRRRRTGPVRTIAKALRLATSRRSHRPGQERRVPYHESVSSVGTRHSGAAPTMPFIFDGNGATLDGSAPVPDDQWTHYRDNIFRFRPRSLVQAVLFFHGRSIWPLPLPRGTSCPPRLEPMQWCVGGGGDLLRRGTRQAAARLQAELRRTAHRRHALPGPAGRRPQSHGARFPGRRRFRHSRRAGGRAAERHMHGQRPAGRMRRRRRRTWPSTPASCSATARPNC